jgi:hypothetical protein
MMTESNLPIPGIVGNVSVSRLQACRQHLEEFTAHLHNNPTAQSHHLLRLKLFDELVFTPDRLKKFKSYMKVKAGYIFNNVDGMPNDLKRRQLSVNNSLMKVFPEIRKHESFCRNCSMIE